MAPFSSTCVVPHDNSAVFGQQAQGAGVVKRVLVNPCAIKASDVRKRNRAAGIEHELEIEEEQMQSTLFHAQE